MTRLRVGVVQMSSNDDLDGNLERARGLIAHAAGMGAELIALPENFAYLRREGLGFPCAQGIDGEIVGFLRDQAREHGTWILGGSFPEAIPDQNRVFNTSVLISSQGECVARYRKIHLFDVELGERGGSFRESDGIAPGEDIVVADTDFGPLGMSICYDVRFPELYRKLVERGALIVGVPAAFAPETGKDHWKVLLQARAIENQVYVIAPAQCGRHSADRSSYGRSLIIDPWGLLLAQADDRPGVIVAECDFSHLERIRGSIPCLSHRRV